MLITTKVKGNASPDDPSLRDYWEKRHQKYGKSYWELNSRNYKIAQNQNWKCPICGEPLFNGEELDTHHIFPVAQGGDNSVKTFSTCTERVIYRNTQKPSLPLEVRLERSELETLMLRS